MAGQKVQKLKINIFCLHIRHIRRLDTFGGFANPSWWLSHDCINETPNSSGRSAASKARALLCPRKRSRVVRHRNSGSLGTPRAFGMRTCICLETLGLRNFFQGRFGTPSALEIASGKAVALRLAPELPGAPKCCSGLLWSRLCTRNACLGKPQNCQVVRKACPRQLRNRIAFKQLWGSS